MPYIRPSMPVAIKSVFINSFEKVIMSKPQVCDWQIFLDAELLQEQATKAVLQAAEHAIDARGRFLLVLAGGATPRGVYQRLSEAKADWGNWHIYFGDERCLPMDDPERNSKMAQDAWLTHVAIPPEQIHAIPAETGADAGAAAYNNTLADLVDFDLVLLGLGEDAHTASLFPGHVWDAQPPASAIAVFNAPKPPAERISLTASRLARTRQLIFLVTGAGKRQAVQQWRSGLNVPAAAIAPQGGVEVFVEACCV